MSQIEPFDPGLGEPDVKTDHRTAARAFIRGFLMLSDEGEADTTGRDVESFKRLAVKQAVEVLHGMGINDPVEQEVEAVLAIEYETEREEYQSECLSYGSAHTVADNPFTASYITQVLGDESQN